MSVRHLLRTAAALLGFACAPAFAQTCVGFTDVLANNAFCPSVEWVKNRGITTGCGNGTTYCPNDAVSRIGMAAFLQRMGDKLTPFVIEPVPSQDLTVQQNMGTPQVVCPTGDYAVVGYPRRAFFTGRMNLYNPSANGDFVVEMVYTDDAPGSTAWKAVQNTSAFQSMYLNMAPGHDVTLNPNGFLNLDVGKTYRFAMRVGRYPANNSNTANIAIFCTNHVAIANRTSATTPLDEAAYVPVADPMPPQGRAMPRP
jgi:hypothetical protein